MKLDCYLLCVCVLGGRNGLGAGGLRKFAYTAYSFYFPLGAPWQGQGVLFTLHAVFPPMESEQMVCYWLGSCITEERKPFHTLQFMKPRVMSGFLISLFTIVHIKHSGSHFSYFEVHYATNELGPLPPAALSFTPALLYGRWQLLCFYPYSWCTVYCVWAYICFLTPLGFVLFNYGMCMTGWVAQLV
jgi:hypothetical protein